MYLFKIFFDADGSGVVTKGDFEQSIKKLGKAKGWSEGDEKYKVAEKAMLDIWQGMQLKADLNKDGEITADEWIAMWEGFAKDPSSPVDWQGYFCKAIFHIQDSSGDGAIDKNEFVSVHSSFGQSQEEAGKAFDKVANGKSSLSYDDFQKLWAEFFSSEDPDAPGNFIFGNLNF